MVTRCHRAGGTEPPMRPRSRTARATTTARNPVDCPEYRPVCRRRSSVVRPRRRGRVQGAVRQGPLVRVLGVSSRYLRAEYTGRINRIGMGSVFWSRSYFAGSCGGAPLTVIRQYIEGQKPPA
ncbi:transposase [Streptomyces sp. NPDC056227]|uniref:transposase n=1 Tax=Streptomyces sp. NPDC056227 TaxID=3345753 RepID=UPI0035D697CC